MIKVFKHLKKPYVVVVGGGTGGHIFPAQAVAEKLHQRGHHVLYMTDTRGLAYHAKPAGVPMAVLKLPPYRPGLMNKISLALCLASGIVAVSLLFLWKRPALVVGFGGYPSFPPLAAAVVERIPFMMHEQNAYVGRVTRWLARFAEKITSTFPSMKGVRPADLSKIVLTGNPIRPSIKALRNMPYKAPSKSIHLFVVGGSQGAKIFSTLLPEAIALLPADLRQRLSIVQQCRPEFEQATTTLYKKTGVKVTLAPFFQDIAAEYKKAHLILSRAGASTVTELAVIGRPALFFPLPTAMDDHQRHNAQSLVDRKAGWMVHEKGLTAPLLAETLNKILVDIKGLEKAAENIHAVGVTTADELLADVVETLLLPVEK